MDNNITTITKLLQLLDKPLVVFDIGCRWGFQDKWKRLLPNIELIGFDADKAACETLGESEGVSANQVVAKALGAEKGQAELFVTIEPACSSLFQPDLELIKDRPALLQATSLVSVTPVELTTLDEYGIANGISETDFMKLDVQGAELNILKGSQHFLKSIRALEVEVEFNPIYQGQPLFSDIDIFLRAQGFCLWRLSHLQHYGLPSNASQFNTDEIAGFDFQSTNFVGHGGQLYWGEAFYVRNEIAYTKGIRSWQTALRDACIAMVLGFDDLATKSITEALVSCPTEIGAKLKEIEELNIPQYIFKGDFSNLESDGEKNWHWSGHHGILSVRNIMNKNIPVSIVFDAISGTGEETDLIIKSKTWTETIRISGKPKHIERKIIIDQAPLDIHFLCEASRFDPANGDHRELVFRIDNFHFGK